MYVRNRGQLPALILAAACILSACGKVRFPDEFSLPGAPMATPAPATPISTPAPTVRPTPTPTIRPTPTPVPTPAPLREAVLTGEGPEEILALMEEKQLEYVDASASQCYPELLALHQAMPDCVIDYTVDLGGTAVRSTERTATLEKGNAILPEELAEALDYLPWLEQLDIFALDWPMEDCLTVMERHPEIKLIWPVRFIDYVVPSNITCFSSQPRTLFCTTERLLPLFTYCTDLVALDLGHQVLRDLEPLRNLKKLKVLILADSAVTEISALEDLTELEYLELFINAISDFTPLEKLTKMVDLNLCYCNQLDSLAFLDHMPALEMAWFSMQRDRFSAEEKAAAMEAHPDCVFMFLPGRQSTGDGWRQTERNIEIRRAFRNWRAVENFVSWDDVTYQEGAALEDVGPLVY